MIHQGLLVTRTSPGWRVEAGKTSSSFFTAIDVVPVLEAMETSAASMRPSGSCRCTPKSRPSTTTLDIDVRTTAYAASSVVVMRRFHRISRSIGSNMRGCSGWLMLVPGQAFHVDRNVHVEQRRMLLGAVDVRIADVAGRNAPRQRRLEGVAGIVHREQHVACRDMIEARKEVGIEDVRGF